VIFLVAFVYKAKKRNSRKDFAPPFLGKTKEDSVPLQSNTTLTTYENVNYVPAPVSYEYNVPTVTEIGQVEIPMTANDMQASYILTDGNGVAVAYDEHGRPLYSMPFDAVSNQPYNTPNQNTDFYPQNYNNQSPITGYDVIIEDTKPQQHH
jgi:hypothetical protein